MISNQLFHMSIIGKTKFFLTSLIFLLLFSACSETEKQAEDKKDDSGILLEQFCLENPPLIGEFMDVKIFEGGISGMFYIPGTEYEFWLVNDRGPNVVLNDHPLADGKNIKLFPFPDYAPKIMRAQLKDGRFEITEIMEIKGPEGKLTSGLPVPGLDGEAPEIAWSDMKATLAGTHEFGIDAEAIAMDSEGYLWIAEEYRTSIWKLDPKTAKAVQIFTPLTGNPPGIPINEVFAKRRPNRGFESLAISPDGMVYAVPQSPLWNPDRSVMEESRIMRILRVDPVTHETTTFLFEMEEAFGDIRQRDWKIADMVAVNNHQFLIIEHATHGNDQSLQINLIDISEASPLHGEWDGERTYEQFIKAEALKEAGIKVASKRHLIDLTKTSYPSEQVKPEGLAIINSKTLALINDNDYSVDADPETWKLYDTEVQTCLYLIHLEEAIK